MSSLTAVACFSILLSWFVQAQIHFSAACYEIPTCYDQEYWDFWDTHPVGEMLFNMMYPDPTYHFPLDFRHFWQNLTWTMDYTDLSEAELDYNSGTLFDIQRSVKYAQHLGRHIDVGADPVGVDIRVGVSVVIGVCVPFFCLHDIL